MVANRFIHAKNQRVLVENIFKNRKAPKNVEEALWFFLYTLKHENVSLMRDSNQRTPVSQT